MSIITKKAGKKRYTFSICTDEILPNGRHKYINGPYFLTKKEAKEAEAVVLAQLQSGTYVAPSKLTVNELLDLYSSTKADLRPSSIASIKSFTNRVARHYFGSIQISKAVPLDVERYRLYLVNESGLANQTIRETLSFIKTAFTWAVNNDMIGKSPARLLKLPPKEEPKGMHVPIEILLQILRIIKAFDYSNLYIPFLLGGMCGMRISETLAVSADVLEGNEITVRSNLQREDGVLQFTKTKTRTSAREIPLLSFVRHEIEDYQRFIAQSKNEALNKHRLLLQTPGYIAELSDRPWKNDLNLLIVFPDNGRGMCRDHVERRWRRLKKKCPEWLQLVDAYPLLANMRHHDFRHSFGSNLRDRGVPIADVSEILGHSDISFTAKTYALPLENTHKKAMSIFENSIKNLL